jgi:tripartite ATP-independent transporter DctM subunit
MVTDAVAAIMIAADLLVTCGSVVLRSLFDAPLDWSNDVASGLMVGASFFGVAGALARAENPGVLFFVNKLPATSRCIVDAVGALLVVLVSAAVAYNAANLGLQTSGQTTGSGLPLQLNFYPMAVGGAFMTVFALDLFLRRRARDIATAVGITAVVVALYLAWSALSPNSAPSSGTLMALGFVVTLCGGLPIGFALALATLIFIWSGGTLPGVIFAQQMARGIDDFVLLAIPFFILVGYLMEANGMSVRLIALLQRLVGPRRGGMNVVMVIAMVLFSGISGSKTADVAAVGTVLVPAARKAGQNPGSAVALLAASAVMAETIPPCINLIILGFVGNLSIGGLFMAGVVPALMMAVVLIAFCVIFGKRPVQSDVVAGPQRSMLILWRDSAPSLGLILTIFIGFKCGFATATEISAFAALYALVIGGAIFRELGPRAAARCFVSAARRSGLVLFIVAAAQSVSFVLTLQQIPDEVAAVMISLSHTGGIPMFMVLSIVVLVLMGSMLEGAAALIVFGPLLIPVAIQLGVDPLQFGVVLVISMGIGLFAPPLGSGLYGACLIGNVPMEMTVKPILGYLGLLLLCVLVIAFVPTISLALPHALGY